MNLLQMVAWSAMNALPINLGIIGDKCSHSPNSVNHTAQLPSDAETVHRYQIQIEDLPCLHDILWGDSFHARIRLESAPPGLQMCVQMRPAQNERVCGKTFYELTGESAVNDSQEVSVWVFWAPGSLPATGSYKLVMSGI